MICGDFKSKQRAFARAHACMRKKWLKYYPPNPLCLMLEDHVEKSALTVRRTLTQELKHARQSCVANTEMV